MHRLNIRYLLQNLGQTFSLSSSRTIEERAIVVPTSKVGGCVDTIYLPTCWRNSLAGDTFTWAEMTVVRNLQNPAGVVPFGGGSCHCRRWPLGVLILSSPSRLHSLALNYINSIFATPRACRHRTRGWVSQIASNFRFFLPIRFAPVLLLFVAIGTDLHASDRTGMAGILTVRGDSTQS